MDQATGLSLTPQEGFVLSRVDGVSTLAEICLVTGMGRDATLEALTKLHDAGVIQVPGAPARLNVGAGDGSEAQAEADRSTPKEVERSPAQDPDAPLEVNGTPSPDLPPFSPDPSCELSEEKQREIHEFFHRLDSLDFFTLLGVQRGASGRDVQRAFRKISLRYHPDRFYGKNLGEMKGLLEGIFRHLSNVAEYLTDDEQRATYEAELGPEEPPDGAGRTSPDSANPTGAAQPWGTGEQPAARPKRPPRNLSREERLRRLGGVLGMTTREIRAVAQKRKRTPDPGAAAVREGRDAERETRRRERRRATAQRVLSPLVQRKQKAKVHFDEGLRAMLAGKWAAAASSLKLAVTFDPKNEEYQEKEKIATSRAREESARSYAKRAAVEEGMGRFDEAARLYSMAADRHDLANYLIKASEMLVHTGELKQSVDYGKRALALDPNSVTARVALGKAYLAADMPKNARREVDYALKLDPDSRAAKSLLKEVRRHD